MKLLWFLIDAFTILTPTHSYTNYAASLTISVYFNYNCIFREILTIVPFHRSLDSVFSLLCYVSHIVLWVSLPDFYSPFGSVFHVTVEYRLAMLNASYPSLVVIMNVVHLCILFYGDLYHWIYII